MLQEEKIKNKNIILLLVTIFLNGHHIDLV